MSASFQQFEKQLQAQNKRITELETKYLALLENLKALRAELNKRPVVNATDTGNAYVPAFTQWPGATR
jgi:ABC-type phosphate transport system auxiliary subunit